MRSTRRIFESVAIRAAASTVSSGRPTPVAKSPAKRMPELALFSRTPAQAQAALSPANHELCESICGEKGMSDAEVLAQIEARQAAKVAEAKQKELVRVAAVRVRRS